MKRWSWALGLVAVVAVTVGLTVAVDRIGQSSETSEILVTGQTYVFTTGDPTLVGEVVEAPRGEWVRVRLLNNTGTPAKSTWVNLRLVKAISAVDAKDVTRP